MGIGHTRWATRGKPSAKNTYLHVFDNTFEGSVSADDSNVVGVHNGIIEKNYQELKEKLIRNGYAFYSDTDTEAVVKPVDFYYNKYNIGLIDAIVKTMVRVRGSYALVFMFKDFLFVDFGSGMC